MDDDVADALSVDIILPKSSVKPEYKGPSVLRQVLSGLKGVDTRVFEGAGRIRDSRHIQAAGVQVELHADATRAHGLD